MVPDWLMPFFRYVLPLLVIACVAGLVWVRAARESFLRGVIYAVLPCLAAAGGMAYSTDVWNRSNYLNCYEFFHYYLGTKYWHELRYDDLYASVLTAQHELKQRNLPPTVRDLAKGRAVSQAVVLGDAATYRAKFSEERWASFKEDVRFFRSKFSQKGWNRLMSDKGYNATPVYTMVASTLTRWAPTSDIWRMKALAFIDLLFMASAFLCVCWAFGPRTAILLGLVLATQYVTSHSHMKAAFMRTDWIMCLIMAACMIKLGHWKVAGALLAYATCIRIFPVVFGFGIGALLLHTLARERRIGWQYVQCLGVFGGVTFLLVGMSWLYTGTAYWQEFLAKITDHNDDISPWRVGFKYVWLLSYRGATEGAASLAEQYAAWSVYYRAVQASVLLLAVYLVRGLKAYEVFCFGIVAAFMLIAPTYYYYIMILIPALYFAARIDEPRHAFGFVLILVAGMVAHWTHGIWDRSFQQFFAISVMVMGILAYMLGVAAWESMGARRPAVAVLEEAPEAA